MQFPPAKSCFVALALACLSAEVSSLRLGDAMVPWYQALNSFHFPHFAATDLNGSNPLAAIKNIDADKVLVEFYAPWCPHCQHFASHYERVAQTLLEQGGKRAAAATVDCVMFEQTCADMNVQGYPTMMWASKADWLADPPKVTELQVYPTAEAVTEWVGKQLNLPSLSPVSKAKVAGKFHQMMLELQSTASKQESGVSASPIGKADTWDMQLAVALLLRSALTELEETPRSALTELEATQQPDKLQVLQSFVDLLQQRFPDEKCHASLSSLSARLSKGAPLPDDLESAWQLCGTPWQEYGLRGWRSCRGTFPNKRGFTCGLWTLFHSLAARCDGNAGKDLNIMRETIASFFQCEECRDHFMGLPVTEADGKDCATMQLWWWKAHNSVNARVKEIEEREEDGDPAFSKIQWPTRQLCKSCAKGDSANVESGRFLASPTPWDQNEVASFLSEYYGS